jgi:hypothetical protein
MVARTPEDELSWPADILKATCSKPTPEATAKAVATADFKRSNIPISFDKAAKLMCRVILTVTVGPSATVVFATVPAVASSIESMVLRESGGKLPAEQSVLLLSPSFSSSIGKGAEGVAIGVVVAIVAWVLNKSNTPEKALPM